MTQIPKCTLVPTRFCDEKDPRCFLSEVFPLGEDEAVETAALPAYDALLVYAPVGKRPPELLSLLRDLPRCPGHYKIAAGWEEGCLSLAVAAGERLLFANVFPAEEFVTAEYFIFATMKSLQLNPEVSTLHFRTPLGGEEEMSLCRYFRSVEAL